MRNRFMLVAVSTAAAMGLALGSGSAANAVIHDIAITEGKSGGNGNVYYTTDGPQKGVKLPVYENRMASFPAGKQFAGLRNTYGGKRFIAQEYAGVEGGTITCVKPGGVLWLDSSATRAWVVTSIANYTCTPGHSERVD